MCRCASLVMCATKYLAALHGGYQETPGFSCRLKTEGLNCTFLAGWSAGPNLTVRFLCEEVQCLQRIQEGEGKIKVDRQDVFFALLLRYLKPALVRGEVNFSSRSFNTLFLLGLKCLKAEWGKKKSRWEGQAPSFLMRNTKKERISVPLHVSRCSPVAKSQGQGQGGGGMTRNPLETHSVGS